jgi:hypothetical protein
MGQMDPWAWEDVMDLDDNMLVHATAWMSLSHDDINTNAMQDQQNLADDRFNEITVNLARRKMTPNPSGSGVPYMVSHSTLGLCDTHRGLRWSQRLKSAKGPDQLPD